MKTLTKPANVRLVAAIVSLILVSALIVRTTQAAFSAQTDNAGNSFAAGTLDLTNSVDDGSTYAVSTTGVFGETGLLPGDAGSDCIQVKYAGPVSSNLTAVQFAVTSDGGSLGDHVDVTVELLAGGCGTAVASTLVTSTPLSSVGSVDTGWTPGSTGEVRSFQIGWQLGSDTPDDQEGASVAADFDWSLTVGS